jgi:hypothetical protein
MDRLWALKHDFDPFRWLLPLNGVGFLLRITRSTVYRCPYCRWIFKLTWGPSNSLLGSGERTCWHCKRVFWDGSNEWPEMSDEERRLFALPISVAGYLGGFLVLLAAYIGAVAYDKQPVKRQDLILLGIFSFPLIMWIIFRLTQVLRSTRRYNARGVRENS